MITSLPQRVKFPSLPGSWFYSVNYTRQSVEGQGGHFLLIGLTPSYAWFCGDWLVFLVRGMPLALSPCTTRSLPVRANDPPTGKALGAQYERGNPSPSFFRRRFIRREAQ